MPRLIVLLLTLASLTVLTVQNLGADKAVSLVVLGTPLSSIPLGLLLLGAVGVGALTTLVLYGLMGLRRPTENSIKDKYKPMGSRVPYPETPGSATTPPTGSNYSSDYTTTTSAAYGSGNAFVTEPPVDSIGTPTSTPTEPDSSRTSSTGSQAANPTTPSNVYSPFSRDSDTIGKKKRPTSE